IDYFNSGDTTKAGKPWTLDFERIGLNNLRFRYKNMLRDSLVKGMNFNDLDVRHFSTVVRNVDVKNHIFKASIRNLTFNEKSGFYVKNLSANATIDTNQILLQRLYLQTKNSVVKDYLRLGFSSFDDFSDFENKIMMDGDFKNAHISSKDINYFADLEKVEFELGVSGRIKGRVGNLKAKNLLITAAQGTYIKGNFNLKGLPDWENTLMELDIDQVATNKKDLDYLLARFTGNPKFKAPDIISKFGNVNFSGNFSGLQNDFVAYGAFKTKLGRFDTDINLKINKAGIPAYSGKVTANQFDLGTLINNKIIGRTTFTAHVKGSGDELKNLNVEADAKIKSITVKGYSYSNVVFDGMFRKKVIDGLLSINDRNVKLDLNGSVDLNPKLPVYNFVGTITNANLNKLKLIKDTVTVTTTLRTIFSGDHIDNLNGNIFLSSTRVVDPRNNYMLDSLYLAASGEGSSRLLDFQSDVADGSIKGNYSLATLPSYFKSVVKKYIPSLKTDIVPFKSQNFEFNFKLKDTDPLLAIFMPELKIPDGGNLIGQFNSADQTATVNGFIKTIQYNKMVFHDLIIDESTPTGPAMWISVSINKVDLTDSLYIKDVNITNFLQRDSLNFNIKMSDKNAANQLDLYGLVEFGRDTTAKLKLLPSEVVIEHEKWKLQDMVRIRLLDGKTQVSGFDLSNGEQRVKVDGFISDKAEDKLNLVFQKFRMSTLNTLTKPSGIILTGALDGKVVFSSLLKKPGIDADINIDTLTMNQTLVGNVKIISNLDNEREKAIVKLNILNRGLETMDIEGAYSLAKDTEDVFDFDVNMNQTEAIIFTPFINDLVSDVKGTVSTSLKLTGSPKKPKLNGDVTLNNTGITVNYLKTPYILSDKLIVENSIIKINKLVIKDIKKGQGIANGSVDLNDISNPVLNIDVNAENLMALNTTFKDNHIYFGTAYGTGKFSFTGPVDNMRIDIKATTQEGTVFNIPLNTSSTAGDYDFIRFVSHNDTTKVVEDLTKKFNGVTLNFDLSADEKTVVKIITDYGRLEGRGVTNNLKLNINSLGDFEMFGDFLISSGKFEFTAKNFISKNFAVNQGGTIRWTGDPANAEINLNAVYEVRTSVADLYTAAGLTSPRGDVQVLVQAQLI
ncbi:MAG: translocation/assembly module TamB domain-containing protein, partial [Mucilaginibacter sp.]